MPLKVHGRCVFAVQGTFCSRDHWLVTTWGRFSTRDLVGARAQRNACRTELARALSEHIDRR